MKHFAHFILISPMLQFDGAQDVLLEGLGVLDASGLALMRPAEKGLCLPSGQVFRRRLISSSGYGGRIANVTFGGLIFRDATTWTSVIENAAAVT